MTFMCMIFIRKTRFLVMTLTQIKTMSISVITESSIYEMVEIGKNLKISATLSTNIDDIKYKWVNLKNNKEINDTERVSRSRK